MVSRSDGNGKMILGWTEWVGLPDWGIPAIRAKLDTGARTSALHVEDVRELRGDQVEFDVVTRRAPERRQTVRAPVARVARVRTSAGVVRPRFVVETTLRLGGVTRRIEVSLVSRRRMLCRMLVGRRALGEAFVVDPAARFTLGGPPRSGEVT